MTTVFGVATGVRFGVLADDVLPALVVVGIAFAAKHFANEIFKITCQLRFS